MRQFLLIAMIVLFAGLPQYVTAADSNVLYPMCDTKVSVDGTLSDPTANYGGAEYMNIGKGSDGYCVSFIAFNLSALENIDVTSMTFTSRITVYGDETRTLAVYVYLGIEWNEMTITGLDNPLNATAIYSRYPPKGNLTTITITPSFTNISINLNDYKDYRGILTLGFTTGPNDASWISLPTKENGYGFVSYIEYSVDNTDSAGSESGGGDTDVHIPSIVVMRADSFAIMFIWYGVITAYIGYRIGKRRSNKTKKESKKQRVKKEKDDLDFEF